MKKLYAVVVLCLISSIAFATRYFPNSVTTPSGSTAAYCVGQTNASYTAAVTMCGSTTGGGAATNTITAQWYWNGTLVYTDPAAYTPSSTAAYTVTIPAGIFTLTPAGTYSLSGTVAGSGLFVRLTWSNAAPAGCTITGTGPLDSAPLTIDVSNPSPITGSATLCVGGTTTLANAAAGGAWNSVTTSVATISGTGVVSGIAAGTSVISYTAGGCTSTRTVTVNNNPPAITGPSSVCAGATITLADATTGGVWSSSAASIALAGTAGDILGVSAGTATISYTAPTGCIATTIVTVNASPAAISGTASVCIGATTSLTDAIAGGTWSSSVTSVATISGSGVVSGLAAGTSVISYIIAGCGAAVTVTVYAPPSAITGPSQVCVGNSISLADATAGGTWSSSNTSVATVNATGGVTGVAAGATLVIYIVNGCAATTVIVVNPNPAPIAPVGAVTICEGATVSFADATSGGTWSSGAALTATVNPGGIVTGVSAGTAVISYVLTSTGCTAVKGVTVNPNPAAIGGFPFVCLSGTTTLTDATASGTWASAPAAVATISAGGVVSGVATGTAIISYTISTGCFDTAVVTVNNAPGPITGPGNVCVSSTIALADTVAGGAWTSSATPAATVGTSGIVTGVAAGVTVISYTIPGCAPALHTVDVFPQPAPITGTMNVCAGFPASLFDATPGGLWSSDDVTKATVGPTSGVVTGVEMGTVTISYANPGGCGIGTVVTVNAMAPITGDNSVCVGGTTYLANIVGGGTWTISNPAIAITTAGTAAVTGVSPGLTYLVYTLPTGCMDSTLISVLPPPPAISGAHVVCRGAHITLTNAATGGTWSSANSFVAGIGSSSGVLTGVYPDTTQITYTLPHHCHTTTVITVNPSPAPVVTFNITSHTLTVGPTTFSSYQWYDSTNGIITGATSPTLVIPGYSAFFYVVVTNSLGCTGSSGYNYIHPAGIIGNRAGQLRVYPNPATGIVHIDIAATIRTVVSTMDGRSVIEGSGATIDVSELAQGVYLLSVYDEQGTRIAVEKLTKQ